MLGSVLWLILAGICIAVVPALAENLLWVGNPTESLSWHDANNWTPSRVPSTSDVVTLPPTARVFISSMAAANQLIAQTTENSSSPSVILLPSSTLSIATNMVFSGNLTIGSGATLTAASINITFARLVLDAGSIRSQSTILLRRTILYTGRLSSITAQGGVVISDKSVLAAFAYNDSNCQTQNTTFKIFGDLIIGESDFAVYYSQLTSSFILVNGDLHLGAAINIQVFSLQNNNVFASSFISANKILSMSSSHQSTQIIKTNNCSSVMTFYPDSLFVFRIPKGGSDDSSPTSIGGPRNPGNGGAGRSGWCIEGSTIIVVIGERCTMGDAKAIVCATGWMGEDCLTPVCPFACNDRGVCEGTDTSTTPACTCKDNWTGPDCSVPVCPNNCNYHGDCVAAATPTCSCYGGWEGDDCSKPVCNDCGPNQYCEGALNPPTCRCKAGFTGLNCETVTTAKCPNDCSKAGRCNAATGECICNARRGGLDCSVPLCENDCNKVGTCTETYTCICPPPFSGFDCSIASCPGCENGACVAAVLPPVCVCMPGWYGVNCTSRSNEVELYESTTKESKEHGLARRYKLVIIMLSVVVAVAAALVISLFVYRRFWLASLKKSREEKYTLYS